MIIAPTSLQASGIAHQAADVIARAGIIVLVTKNSPPLPLEIEQNTLTGSWFTFREQGGSTFVSALGLIRGSSK